MLMLHAKQSFKPHPQLFNSGCWRARQCYSQHTHCLWLTAAEDVTNNTSRQTCSPPSYITSVGSRRAKKPIRGPGNANWLRISVLYSYSKSKFYPHQIIAHGLTNLLDCYLIESFGLDDSSLTSIHNAESSGKASTETTDGFPYCEGKMPWGSSIVSLHSPVPWHLFMKLMVYTKTKRSLQVFLSPPSLLLCLCPLPGWHCCKMPLDNRHNLYSVNYPSPRQHLENPHNQSRLSPRLGSSFAHLVRQFVIVPQPNTAI
ncbi:hypothetical protein V8C40DRAFT_65000 [Trichoderma camerunense]